jgi:lycopene cyclase domain-containing protein
MEYTFVLIFLAVVALILEYRYRIRLYSSRRERWLIPLFFFFVGLGWDSFAVWRGHWYFDYSNLLGIQIGLLPLEEYLFFVVIPYFILTVYRVLKIRI